MCYWQDVYETAAILSVSEAFLERDRWAGARIPFIKVGARAIRYRLQDIEKYIEDNLCYSTSEGGMA